MPGIRGFKYSKETGNVYRNFLGKRYLPKIVGSIDSRGYLEVKHLGKKFNCHVLALKILNIEVRPGNEIDHKNGKRNDNRFENLRIVSHRENCQNLASHRNGQLVGASKKGNSFTSQIVIDNKVRHLGSFKTEKEASDFYIKASNHVQGYSSCEEINEILNKPARTVLGYHCDKKTGKFMVKYKRKYIGLYNTANEARIAYLSAKNKIEDQ